MKNKFNKISEIPNYQKYFEWDQFSWSTAISFFEKYSTIKLSEACVLELGSRSGKLGLMFNLCGANTVLSDVKNNLDESIKQKLKVDDSLDFSIIDATNINNKKKYDIIVLKSVLGALETKENQKKCIEQVYLNLKKGGEFWIMENLKASIFHRILRYLFIPWSNSWRYIEKEELKLLLEKFHTKKIKSKGGLSLLGKTEKQKNLLSKVDDKLNIYIKNSYWHTVVFALAKK